MKLYKKKKLKLNHQKNIDTKLFFNDIAMGGTIYNQQQYVKAV